jgi:hypothetical protein
MSTADESLLRVAFASNATAQQPPQNDATTDATSAQQATGKPASLLDIARNKLRNNHATSSKNGAQQATQNGGDKNWVAQQAQIEAADSAELTVLEQQREKRRQMAITLLEAHPLAKRAVHPDKESDPDNVILCVAVRNVATVEMLIPKAKYDPLRLLELLDGIDETSH